MKTDRELLELAAKAYGWTGWRSKHGYWNIESPDGEKSTHCHNWDAFCSVTGEKIPEPSILDAIIESGWIPIGYNCEALSLSVKLGIDVRHSKTLGLVEAWVNGACIAVEEYGADPYAATRRAIVRAAAAIGESL